MGSSCAPTPEAHLSAKYRTLESSQQALPGPLPKNQESTSHEGCQESGAEEEGYQLPRLPVGL